MIYVLLALVIGLLIPTAFHVPPLVGTTGTYLAIACVAGLDTVCGGIRGGMEGKFRSDVFFTGFIANVAIAFFLAWLGDQIGVNLYLVAALVLGARVFTNLSLIRRMMLNNVLDARDRRRRRKEVEEAQQTPPQQEAT